MENILVLGYYFKNNWGDDAFQYVFQNYILKNYNIDFCDTNVESLYKLINVNYKCIIIGGGDIVNDYFLNKEILETINSLYKNIPIYFTSIGITYESSIPKLDIGDYFYTRSTKDKLILSQRYNTKYIQYIPDIVFFLHDKISFQKNLQTIKNIGIILPGPLFSLDNLYLTTQIVQLINQLTSKYIIHLIAFDTSNKIDNSDIPLLNWLKSNSNIKPANNIYYYVNNQINKIEKMINYYNTLDLIIGGRYHSIILSLLTNTPFIALECSQKIKNLMYDIPLLSSYFIPVTSTNFNINMIKGSIDSIFLNYNKINDYIKDYNYKFKNILDQFLLDFSNKLTNLPKRNTSPIYLNNSTKWKILQSVFTNVLLKLQRTVSMSDLDNLANGKPLSYFLPKFSNTDTINALKKIITEEILWIITGDPSGPYYYGLYDNIFNNSLNFREQIEWIISDYYTYFYIRPISSKMPIEIINKNFQGIHRSGWQKVVEEIMEKAVKQTEKIIIDTYVDKTFHWNKAFYSSKNIIPYTDKWIGFIHHTFSDYNNNYNCTELFKDSLFIKSLRYCKCLIVMTEYLKKDIVIELEKLNYNNIPVYVLIHPTEFVESTSLFNFDSFQSNSKRQLVQIGNWLRNVFGIYKVVLPQKQTSVVYSKSILKNKNSDNYHLPKNFMQNLLTFFTSYGTIEGGGGNGCAGGEIICRTDLSNMHLKGLYEEIQRIEDSVQIIDYLENNDYDLLLTKNIVFIDLVDASACNTLMECIVRNTPIIVNKIAPVVEILGEDYPLYYDNQNYHTVTELLKDVQLINQAWLYLKTLPKKEMNLDTFITKFLEIVWKC